MAITYRGQSTGKDPKPEDVRCPKGNNCNGTLWNMPVSRLEMGLGIMVLKCDKCNRKWALRIKEEEAVR